jgi:8-oxo-dGTP pyrophosphatase MutT (NUDIX family)
MAERTLASRMAYEGRLISLRLDDVELATGRRARREIVVHPGAVVIVAWNGERLAMVRQWRQAAGAEMLEIPAGTLDPGEMPLAAAERELGEECGLAAGVWVEGPAFYTAPGFSTERLTLFMATDLRPVEVDGPEDEELVRSWMSLPDALAGADDGTIKDAKSLVGIAWLARRLAAPGS